MLLVIFGAGASYDSVPHLPPAVHSPFRPPLANQLFENRPLFVDAMERFRTCMALIPLLRKEGVIVERELAKLKDQAEKFPERHRQLAAIRYYLHFALWECEQKWRNEHKGITNFATLLDEIERWRVESNETVCLVTFNYDTILEHAMSQVLRMSFEDISAYANNSRYSLIKLHGSINWGREVDSISHGPSVGIIPIAGVVHTFNHQRVIEEVTRLHISERYTLVTEHPMLRTGQTLVFPAISIPVEKKDEFMCPELHVLALDAALSFVTKIVTIGWRATEDKFLVKLKSELTKNPDLMIVSGDSTGAKETLRNLGPWVNPAQHFLVDNGFTGLINSLDRLSRFLRQQ